MQLSDLINQPITLRQKVFLEKVQHREVIVTVLRVYERSVKCKIGNGTIYIPIKYFTDFQADQLNKIFHVPTWFSFMSKEELEVKMQAARDYTNNPKPCAE